MLIKEWDQRVQPNTKALLTDEQDLETARAILQVLQRIEILLATAPDSIQKSAQEWSDLIASKKWEGRESKLRVYYRRSKERQKNMLTEQHNPDLSIVAPQGVYNYQDPNKKDQLYRKGKEDSHEIAANDVQQGDLDDCFILAPIAALAQSDPTTIKRMISLQKDGSYKVTLHLRMDANTKERTKTIIHVKNEFVRTKAGKAAYAGMGDRELWVQVLEKAYAQAMGSYTQIAQGGDPSEMLEVFTGKEAVRAALKTYKKEELLVIFEIAIKNKKPVVISSKISNDTTEYEILLDGQRITTNHSYYLHRVSEKLIFLKNPKGIQHLEITWKDLFEHFTYYSAL